MTCYCAFAAWLIAMLPGQTGNTIEHQAMVSSGISNRVLKKFDFDERGGGNFETIPMGWTPIAGPNYPRFTEPRFDGGVGHDAAPSFRFDLSSGNVGAGYVNESINVHPDSDYEISAWIRSSGIQFASASVSAVLLDHALNEIKESRCRSEMPSDGARGEWRQVRVTVRGGFQKARWLGIYCNVEQSAADRETLRPIERQDVRGTVWFDDISVTRLPRVELELKRPSAVFTMNEPPTCRVKIKDINSADLSCRLLVRDGDGRTCLNKTLASLDDGEPDSWMDLSPLQAGWYEAVLDVRSGDQSIVERRRSFVRLARTGNIETTKATRGYGLICDPFEAGQAAILAELLGVLRPAAVKLPVWSKGLTDDEILKGSPEYYKYLNDITERGIGAVGVLEEVPDCLESAWRQSQSSGTRVSHVGVESVLSSPPELWRAYAALPMTRYGRFFDAWQVGGDLSKDIDAGLQGKAINAIWAEFPSLKIYAAPHSESESERSDQRVSGPRLERVSSTISATHMLSNIARKPDGHDRWMTIEPLPTEVIDQRTRRAEFAQKLLLSRFSGAALTFSRQPWQLARQDGAWIAFPDEELVIQHTLGQALSGLSPVQKLQTRSDVMALLWSDAARRNAVITAWTPGDGADVEWTMDGGRENRVIDIWGRVHEPSRTMGGEIVRLGPIPSIISNVQADRVLLAFEMQIAPATLTPGMDQPCRLTIKNPRKDNLRGELELELPARWHVNPSRVAVDIPPGGKFETEVSVRVPINEPSGEIALAAQFLRMGDAMHGLTLRTPIRVGSQGVDVNVMTRLDEDGLHVYQRVSSLIDGPIRLQSFVVGDGKRLQGGVFELPSRQTVVREYLLDRQLLAQDVPIRVSIEQIGGPIRDNRLIVTR